MPTGAPSTALKTSKRLRLLIQVPFTVIVDSGAQAAAAENPKTFSEQRYEEVNDPSLYAGAETCTACHEDISKNFDTTPHFVTTLENKRGQERQGWEACHSPDKEYVQSGGDETKTLTFKGVSAAVSSARWKKG